MSKLYKPRLSQSSTSHFFTPWSAVCPPDKFRIERYLYKGQCLDACPEAFYHTKERSCEPCSDHCRLCTSPTHCLRCNSSYYVSDGVCAKLECGEGKQGQSIIYELAFLYLLWYTVTQCERWPWKALSHACLPLALSHPLFLIVSSLYLSFTLSFRFFLRGGGGSRLRRLHGLWGGLQEVCLV